MTFRIEVEYPRLLTGEVMERLISSMSERDRERTHERDPNLENGFKTPLDYEKAMGN